MSDERLDSLLGETCKRDATVSDADRAAAERVFARLSSLPKQRVPFWRLPGLLLDWQFAPAWPRMAALASCALIGFAIGLSGIDRTVDAPRAPYSFVSGTDFGAIVLDPAQGNGGQP